jgi:hypothetical protein
MSSKVKIKNKDYVRCNSCNSYLFYGSDILDEKGNPIPLDINGKRHFCDAAHRLVHEEQVLINLQNRLAFANMVEFSGIQLGLVDTTEQAS